MRRWASPAWARLRGVYSHSLLLAMTVIFLASWLAQSLTSWRSFNEEETQHGGSTVEWSA